jgi:hypothetical protein
VFAIVTACSDVAEMMVGRARTVIYTINAAERGEESSHNRNINEGLIEIPKKDVAVKR